jgi:hypothetical protein
MGAHVLGRAPDRRQSVPGQGDILQVLGIFGWDLAGHPREPENVAVKEVQLGGVCSAKPRGVLDDGVQYVPGVGGRTAESREDFAARRGLVARVPQLLPE